MMLPANAAAIRQSDARRGTPRGAARLHRWMAPERRHARHTRDANALFYYVLSSRHLRCRCRAKTMSAAPYDGEAHDGAHTLPNALHTAALTRYMPHNECCARNMSLIRALCRCHAAARVTHGKTCCGDSAADSDRIRRARLSDTLCDMRGAPAIQRAARRNITRRPPRAQRCCLLQCALRLRLLYSRRRVV